jgi:hypothetical protein
MLLRPVTGRSEPATVPEKKRRQPMAGAQEIGAEILTTPQQGAGRLFLLRRNGNRGQRTGPMEHGEPAGIAAIGLDAIAGVSPDQCGRDHVARNRQNLHSPVHIRTAPPPSR